MDRKRVIEAISMTIEGLSIIKEELSKDSFEDNMNVPVEEVTSDDSTEEITEEQLRSMKFSDFKKYATQLGVNCTGTRDEIIERILNKDAVEEEEVEQEIPKSNNNKVSKKSSKKEVVEENSDEDEFDEQAREIIEDTPIEDVIEALKDVGIKATKKNVAEKLAYALREGLIDLEEEGEDVIEESEDNEILPDSYNPNFDPEGLNSPNTMTEERRKAVIKRMKDIIDSIEKGSLTTEDIQSYVEDNATDDEIETLGEDYSDSDILSLYMELIKRTIDNDGEEHEPSDLYEIGDSNMCCGRELKYSKKTKMFICEHCGEEYESE